MNQEELTSLKLANLFPISLDLTWHENRSSYFSCRKQRRLVCLRLHRLFIKAPSPVLEAVVGYAMTGDRKSGMMIRQMAHLYFSKIQTDPKPLSSKGQVYDLLEIHQPHFR